MPQDILNVVISHSYVNSRRPLGIDNPGLSIMTANSWPLSLDKLDKNVNFAVIVGYSLGFEPGTCIDSVIHCTLHNPIKCVCTSSVGYQYA